MEGERERQENDSGKERMEYVTLKHDGHVTWSTKEVTIRVTQSISTWARQMFGSAHSRRERKFRDFPRE